MAKSEGKKAVRMTRDDVELPSLPPWQATEEAWKIGLRLLSEVADAAREATARWPVVGYQPEERLSAVRGYLPADLREKVDSQARKWALACRSAGLDDLRHEQARMLRAWAAVGNALQGTSPEPLSWHWKLSDGSTLVLVRSEADLVHTRPPAGSQVWAIEEVARLIESLPADLRTLKATFRGSTLSAIARNEQHGGEIAPKPGPFVDDDLDSINWTGEKAKTP